MARDKGLETLLADDLDGLLEGRPGARPGLTGKAMFGGWAWMLDGHLLCCVRKDGLLARLGRDRDGWALGIAGVSAMMSGERRMQGWVRAAPEMCADPGLRRRLLQAALAYVLSLPPK